MVMWVVLYFCMSFRVVLCVMRLCGSRSFLSICRNNMLDVCCDLTSYDEYVALVKAGNECQPTAHMSSHGNLYNGGLLRGSVVPVKFLLVLLNTLLAEPESHNALVVIWSVERSTSSITERDTVQTERVLVRLVDHSASP